MSGSHDHGPAARASTRELQRRALWIALLANGGFLGAEVIGGLAFNSLALLADAAHMLSDVVGLAIALAAQQLLSRPATTRHSYGLQRSEVFGGQLNGLTLLAAAAWIIYEAVQRIGEPAHVKGGGMLIVAVLGLAVNVGSAVMLARACGRSINMKGAFLHMVVDAVGSVGAITAAIAVLVFGADWVDPAVSLLLAALVIWSAWSLLRDTTHVMLEGAPNDVDPAAVEAALLADGRVAAVHHIHLWSLASDVTAFSGHVVIEEPASLHDAQIEVERLKAILSERFDIDHATIETECHPCVAEPADSHASTQRDAT